MITAKRQKPDSSWANKLRVESAACASNEVLLDQDQNILRALLTEAQLEVDTLDMEIPRLQALLDNHKQRRATGIERLTRLRMGIAPHKKLPPELLARIFVESMDQGSVHIPLQGLPLPWVLAQVCSRWRAISRAEPLLWSRLYISTLRRKRSALPIIKDILSNHGGRGRVELSIGTLTNGEWSQITAFLPAYFSRVWRLNLTFSNPISPIPALSKPLKLFDELESLSLSLYNGDLINHENQTFYAFSTTQNLLELKVKTIVPFFGDVDVNGGIFPCAQLTSLTLSNMTAAPVLTILTQCPHLQNLSVELPSVGGQSSAPVVSLHHLRFMSVTGSTCSHFCDMLTGLIVPSLEHIILIHKSHRTNPLCLDRQLVMSLAALIERSRCDLDSIQTESIVINPEDIVALMKVMPALTSWDIPTQSQIPESTLSTILEGGLVPNLRTVKGWEVSSVYSALHFLNSRWSQTSSGNYEGIRHSAFSIKMLNYRLADRAYFRSILPELQTHGRSIHLKMG